MLGEVRIVVSNQAELKAALTNRTANTVIVIKGGNYGDLAFNAKNSPLGIHLVAADPSKPPVFGSLSISNANGVSIDGVNFSPAPGLKFANGLTIKGSSNIALTNNTFLGQTGAFDSQQRGLLIDHSTGITVSGNSFSGLMRGGIFTESSNLKITYNTVTGNRSEGFNFSSVQKVEIARNTMSNFIPVASDHPDFIQFWTNGASSASTDINIHDNTFTQAAGGIVSVQGIFMDNDDHIRYQNVTIQNNTIQTGMPHGILLQEADGVTITNNVALTVDGSRFRVGIAVTDATNVNVIGNTTNSLTLVNDINLVNSGNAVTTQLVGSTPLRPDEVTKVRFQSFNQIGTDGEDRLTGGNYTDCIDGGAGNDILNGGRGNDIIIGGAGNDILLGGGGADVFVFCANTHMGSETDKIMDFSFVQGDTLEFRGFGANVFGSLAVDGVIEIASMSDLAALAPLDNVKISRRGTTDTLVLSLRNGTDTQEIQFSNVCADYTKSFGLFY